MRKSEMIIPMHFNPPVNRLAAYSIGSKSLDISNNVSGGGDGVKKPRFTIVLTGGYNRIRLSFSLGRLLWQTCTDFELIIPDGDHDSVMNLCQQGMSPSAVQVFSSTGDLHLDRKQAVDVAKGSFVLFMSAGDGLTPDALSSLVSISEGKDIIFFNSFVEDGKGKTGLEDRLNAGPKGEWIGPAVLETLFSGNSHSPEFHNKLYRADLCRQAFEIIPDTLGLPDPESCEALILASLARKVAKIDKKIYFRFNDYEAHDSFHACCSLTHNFRIWPAFHSYLTVMGLNDYRTSIKNIFMSQSVHELLITQPGEFTQIFDNMASAYGIVDFVTFLCLQYFRDWSIVADVFRHYSLLDPTASPERIGILFTEFANGGTERVTLDMAILLLERGYEVTLFLERAHANDIALPRDINIVYVPMEWYDEKQIGYHLSALDVAVGRNRIDVMVCPACWNNTLLWQTMLLRYRKIPIVMYNHMAFFERLLSADKVYDTLTHSSVLGCADKVICLSRYSEIFYRLMGANAEYIANPIAQMARAPISYEERKNNVLVFGRLGDPTKGVGEALRVIALVSRKIPQVRATFVGPLESREEREVFYNLARKLGIEDNVHVTGWMSDPAPFIERASVLLSCAWQEAFPLTICQAQSFGIPCVMYDLPIMPAENNPAIIRVRHRDFKSSAEAIVDLLTDEKKWHALSRLGHKKVSMYSPESYIGKIIDVFERINKSSKWSPPSTAEFSTIMRVFSFYAADLSPWHEK